MSTYLDLVNKVILESGKEQTLLTEDTWDSLDANRRLYPRIKRLVREAWRTIQMSRNEWEFNTARAQITVPPRLSFVNGFPANTGDPAYGHYVGEESGTVIDVYLFEPDDPNYEWGWGFVAGQAEFFLVSGNTLKLGETFVSEEDEAATFVYTGTGSYNFVYETLGMMREPHWTTFVAGAGTPSPNPVYFVPWDNFTYKTFSFMSGSRVRPTMLSQDYNGRIVFYPQPLEEFSLSFVYDVAPQELSDPQDEPFNLPSEYHDWIAWRALMNLARYDKDPDLFAYAESMHTAYQRRAERNLLPIPSYRVSPYNVRTYSP